jgi:hypothetical protein
MEVDYYSKYLKYKKRYLELKAQIGSAVTKTTKKECSKHGHAYCSTLAIGCHWNGKKCVINTCYENDFGYIRGPDDCRITMGCTWDSNKDKCDIKK